MLADEPKPLALEPSYILTVRAIKSNPYNIAQAHQPVSSYTSILSASILNCILNILCLIHGSSFTLVLFLAGPPLLTRGCKQEYWHHSLAGKSTWKSLHQPAELWKTQGNGFKQSMQTIQTQNMIYWLSWPEHQEDARSEINFAFSFCQQCFSCSFLVHLSFHGLGLLPDWI